MARKSEITTSTIIDPVFTKTPTKYVVLAEHEGMVPASTDPETGETLYKLAHVAAQFTYYSFAKSLSVAAVRDNLGNLAKHGAINCPDGVTFDGRTSWTFVEQKAEPKAEIPERVVLEYLGLVPYCVTL